MTVTRYSFDKSMSRPRRPLKAWRHFRKLIANKEDTTQVFYVIDALNGDSFQKKFVEFANSERGQALLDNPEPLPPILDNHDHLRTLPEGSLGRAYLDFMTREGLTAQGLVDEYEASGIGVNYDHDEMQYYGDRRRDTHDMLHVLTGLGRDALGEASVLGFSYAQHGGLGVGFIAYGAAMEVRKSAPKGAPVLKAVREAQKIGKAANDIVCYDIMDLLPRPIEEVRDILNITLPTYYHEVHRLMHEDGIDPYGVVGAEPTVA